MYPSVHGVSVLSPNKGCPASPAAFKLKPRGMATQAMYLRCAPLHLVVFGCLSPGPACPHFSVVKRAIPFMGYGDMLFVSASLK